MYSFFAAFAFFLAPFSLRADDEVALSQKIYDALYDYFGWWQEKWDNQDWFWQYDFLDQIYQMYDELYYIEMCASEIVGRGFPFVDMFYTDQGENVFTSIYDVLTSDSSSSSDTNLVSIVESIRSTLEDNIPHCYDSLSQIETLLDITESTDYRNYGDAFADIVSLLGGIYSVVQNREFCNCNNGSPGDEDHTGDNDDEEIKSDLDDIKDSLDSIYDVTHDIYDLLDEHLPELSDDLHKLVGFFDKKWNIHRKFLTWKSDASLPVIFTNAVTAHVEYDTSDPEASDFCDAVIKCLENAQTDREQIQLTLLHILARLNGDDTNKSKNQAHVDDAEKKVDDISSSDQGDLSSNFSKVSFSDKFQFNYDDNLGVDIYVITSGGVTLPNTVTLFTIPISAYFSSCEDFTVSVNCSEISGVITSVRSCFLALYYGFGLSFLVFCLFLFFKYGKSILHFIEKITNW